MMTLFKIAQFFALACFAIAMLCAMVRMLLGPTAQDRVLALDLLYLSVVLSLLVLGIMIGHKLYFEVALIIAFIGFVSTIATAKFLMRGEVIE